MDRSANAALFAFDGVEYKDILRIPSLAIENGVTALVGPSGGGKTTMLRLMNKLISPTRGRVLFMGEDLRGADSVAHRRRVTMLSQNPVVFAGTVRDNLAAGLIFRERDVSDDAALTRALSQAHLDANLDAPAQPLSGGEKQRLALARVLLLDPEVYLLDEPSASLDEATGESVIRTVAQHVRAAGRSLVMVTHASGTAFAFSDTVVEIAGGKFIGRRDGDARDH